MGNLLNAITKGTVNTATKKASTAIGKTSAKTSSGSDQLSAKTKGSAQAGGRVGDKIVMGAMNGLANGVLGVAYTGANKAYNTAANALQSSGGGGGYGGYGGGYGGYGGGGGSTGPTDEQKEAARALGGLAAKQAQATKDKFNNVKDALNKANQNAQKTKDLNAHAIGRQSSAEWYHNALENPQKTVAAMRDRAGNALNGSMRLSLMDDAQRVFDDQTVAAITNEMQQKNDNIYEYVQTVNKNINELNKMAADTESALAQGANDYISQLLNIHPDLATGKEKGFSKLVDTSIFKTDNKAKKGATAKEKAAVNAKNKAAKNLTTAQAANAIKIPTSLAYSGYYNQNKQNLLTPSYLTQVRPANAREAARKLNTTSQGNTASAANPNYLNALTTPYGKRTH